MSQIYKKSCGHFKSPELEIFQRKSPLVLFESKKMKKNQESKHFSVSTQTLLNLDSSEAETQTTFDSCVASCQTDIESLQLWQPQPQSIISSIQYHHLTMSKIYQPARHFSPMATFLNVMGNDFFVIAGTKFTQESIKDRR